jgi:hypothetical protein
MTVGLYPRAQLVLGREMIEVTTVGLTVNGARVLGSLDVEIPSASRLVEAWLAHAGTPHDLKILAPGTKVQLNAVHQVMAEIPTDRGAQLRVKLEGIVLDSGEPTADCGICSWAAAREGAGPPIVTMQDFEREAQRWLEAIGPRLPMAINITADTLGPGRVALRIRPVSRWRRLLEAVGMWFLRRAGHVQDEESETGPAGPKEQEGDER